MIVKTKTKNVLLVFSILLIGIVLRFFIFNSNNAHLNKIKKSVKNIREVSSDGHFQRLYVSIIYAELMNNFDYMDKLDNVRAKYGFDPSVGFAQIRVSTFYWIEENSNNTLIIESKDKDDLLNKIATDSINILYSAEYIRMINALFMKKYGKSASIKSLGSYYSAGIDYGKDDVDSNYFNIVGRTAEEFYNSDILINEFPRLN